MSTSLCLHARLRSLVLLKLPPQLIVPSRIHRHLSFSPLSRLSLRLVDLGGPHRVRLSLGSLLVKAFHRQAIVPRRIGNLLNLRGELLRLQGHLERLHTKVHPALLSPSCFYNLSFSLSFLLSFQPRIFLRDDAVHHGSNKSKGCKILASLLLLLHLLLLHLLGESSGGKLRRLGLRERPRTSFLLLLLSLSSSPRFHVSHLLRLFLKLCRNLGGNLLLLTRHRRVLLRLVMMRIRISTKFCRRRVPHHLLLLRLRLGECLCTSLRIPRLLCLCLSESLSTSLCILLTGRHELLLGMCLCECKRKRECWDCEIPRLRSLF
mmetsp:Transcript_2269/g.6125  ORF Transcript_2269/g.6125 Transcript_2269/m.6125 type:complete len:320 (+) Transcript_2269:216-1175(+)